MTRGRLSLERFGTGPVDRASAPGASPASDEERMHHEQADAALHASAFDRLQAPEPGPALDAFRIECPEADQQPDRSSAQAPATGPIAERGPRHDPLVERAAALGRIAAALDQIVAEQGALRTRSIREVSQALGAVAETLLPRLAREGFAAAVAGATETIARQGHWPELTLRVAAEDADPVAAMLRHPAGGPSLRLVPDPELTPGEAQLDWADGGAEIDVGAIIELARERFRQRLATAGKEQDA